MRYREKIVFRQEQITELSKEILTKLLQRSEIMKLTAEEMKKLE